MKEVWSCSQTLWMCGDVFFSPWGMKISVSVKLHIRKDLLLSEAKHIISNVDPNGFLFVFYFIYQWKRLLWETRAMISHRLVTLLTSALKWLQCWSSSIMTVAWGPHCDFPCTFLIFTSAVFLGAAGILHYPLVEVFHSHIFTCMFLIMGNLAVHWK